MRIHVKTLRLWLLVATLLPMVTLLPACKSAAPAPTTEAVIKEALPETTEVPGKFKAAGDVDTGKVDDGWIEEFGDPELVALVDEALKNNLNLRIAATQVDAAAAAAVIAGARLKPTVDFGLGASESGAGTSGSGKAQIGLSASWEIDVWGKLASGAAAAEASLAAAQANFEFGRQSLAAQTAKGWFMAVQTSMLLDLGLETVDLFQQTLDLVNAKYEIGQVTMKDVHLAKADLASSEEAVRQAKGANQQAKRSLELLLGRYPGAEITARKDLPQLPPPIPAGLPSDLLERRPDLIVAKDYVAAAFYLTEQAKAAKLPSFAINAGLGTSTDVKDLISNLGAGIFAPLFRGGALEAQVDSADAQQRAAISAYGMAVLKALEEVEAGLTNSKLESERESFLLEVLHENEQAWDLAKAQFEVGKIDLLSVLQMQARVVGARIAVINIRSDQLITRVNLHLALGGSFEEAGSTLPASAGDPQEEQR